MCCVRWEAAFRSWLEAHHETATELWLGTYKKATGKPSVSWSDAVDEIVAQRGRQFDPRIVDAFVSDEPALRAVYEDLSLVA